MSSLLLNLHRSTFNRLAFARPSFEQRANRLNVGTIGGNGHGIDATPRKEAITPFPFTFGGCSELGTDTAIRRVHQQKLPGLGVFQFRKPNVRQLNFRRIVDGNADDVMTAGDHPQQLLITCRLLCGGTRGTNLLEVRDKKRPHGASEHH